jgi:hypothetical protein
LNHIASLLCAWPIATKTLQGVLYLQLTDRDWI